MNNTANPLQSRFLWFERAGQTFAVSMDCLHEVLSAPALRPVPVTEPALKGLMVLREYVLPVFDTALLANSEMPPSVTSPIVILLGLYGRPFLGLLAERVGKVIELPPPGPLTVPMRLSAAFAGETKGPDRARIHIFDVPALAATMGLAAEATAVGDFTTQSVMNTVS
ncbi:MAG TPA: chemotaxis protein CheW [Clostridia bacterium]|nr:chemotaxis protein CheW [Clostridia bacterium]